MKLINKFPHLKNIGKATLEEQEELDKEYYEKYQGLGSEFNNHYITALECGLSEEEAYEYAKERWEAGFKGAEEWRKKNGKR